MDGANLIDCNIAHTQHCVNEQQRNLLAEFKLAKYQLVLAAKEHMLLPEFKGSMFRGGFGHVLKKVCCSDPHGECQSCILKERCPYAYIFETSPPQELKHFGSNRNVPRPYLFEPPLNGRREYNKDDELAFGLTLIGRGIEFLPYFIVAIREMGEVGVTKRRHKFGLRSIESVDEMSGGRSLIYSSDDQMVHNRSKVLTYYDCVEEANRLSKERITLNFLSPTKIKFGGEYLFNEIPFQALIQALTIRINALNSLHCGGQWDDSLRDLRDRAAGIKLVSSDLERQGVLRYSSRQKMKTSLSGATGSVIYEGDLKDFLPLLVLGQFIHIGDNCVFGCGKYQVIAN